MPLRKNDAGDERSANVREYHMNAAEATQEMKMDTVRGPKSVESQRISISLHESQTISLIQVASGKWQVAGKKVNK